MFLLDEVRPSIIMNIDKPKCLHLICTNRTVFWHQHSGKSRTYSRDRPNKLVNSIKAFSFSAGILLLQVGWWSAPHIHLKKMFERNACWAYNCQVSQTNRHCSRQPLWEGLGVQPQKDCALPASVLKRAPQCGLQLQATKAQCGTHSLQKVKAKKGSNILRFSEPSL